MKISGSLLQLITLGLTVSVINTGCHTDGVKDRSQKPEKVKNERETKAEPDNCPACGRG